MRWILFNIIDGESFVLCLNNAPLAGGDRIRYFQSANAAEQWSQWCANGEWLPLPETVDRVTMTLLGSLI